MDTYNKHELSFCNMSLQKISTFAPLPIRIMAGIAFILHGLPNLKVFKEPKVSLHQLVSQQI